MNPTLSFKENDISKQPALDLLQKLGFKYITPDEALAMRGGKLSNVLLETVLKNQLKEINSITVNYSKETRFSEQNIENGVEAMHNIPIQNGYISANEYVYNLLTLGKAFEQNIDGDKKSYTMRYIDWENPERNVYHVTDEFAVSRSGCSDTYRPDIVLFVNGIPLVIIECKRPDVKDALEQAISQQLRNQKEDGIRGLYQYSALLLCVGNSFAKYATTASDAKFWNQWAEQDKEEQIKTVSELTGRIPTPQDLCLHSLCQPARLLDIIYNFTVYDNGIKKVARYQQYFAVKEIDNRIRVVNGGKRNGGVIWHTQGSGKSLTMVMLAQTIAQNKDVHNARIVLVTDRTDLDSQITKTFRKCGRNVSNAKTGAHLVELLESNTDDIITTVINKFETAIKRIKTPLESPDIFILIDEAHRSQYSELAITMDKVLPNACKIAFTGTPLMKSEKNTAAKFGGIINPVYTIKQAVEDGAVVPLLYEGILIKQNVKSEQLDKNFNIVSEPFTEYQKADFKKKYSKSDIIHHTDQRMYNVACHLSKHFKDNWQGTMFKAMLVTSKKKIAIEYKKLLDELGMVTSEVLITAPDDREGEDSSYGDITEAVKAFWKKMMDEHGTPKKYQENLINRFKYQDNPEIMIVVDKLLTGFDEPKVAVMYIDRSLKDHTLLQAIARVNRVCEDKDFGYIIDYYGVLKDLNDAMQVYGSYEQPEQDEINSTLMQIQTEIDKLPAKHSELVNLFRDLPDKNDLEAYAVALRMEDKRQEFYDKLTAFASCLKVALSSYRFHKDTPDNQIQMYKDDLRKYSKIRTAVQLRYSDTVDFKKYEGQIQKLLNMYVESEDAKPITQLVNIFDADAFEKEVEQVVGNVAKADTIASRTSKYITEQTNTDPAFYMKFSEMLKETINAYQQGRISELEYLNKVKEIHDNVLNHTDNDVPAILQNNPSAKAYFGIALGVYKKWKGSAVPAKQMALETAQAFYSVIDSVLNVDGHILVDWTLKSDVIGRIKNEMEDFLIDNIKAKYQSAFSFDEMDIIINSCVEVAKLWIR
ncbi:MAG: type I restriction endonuclease subunit R [Paludibacteraceae bacterium]|nr:type I restriction endonuclease subunit R [Paludibacteraceae bacterium]